MPKKLSFTAILVTQENTDQSCELWRGLLTVWDESSEGFEEVSLQLLNIKGYSAYISILWPVNPDHSVTKQDPDLSGQNQTWKTHMTPAKGVHVSGCKISQKPLLTKSRSTAAYHHSSEDFHVLTDFPEGGLGVLFFRENFEKCQN